MHIGLIEWDVYSRTKLSEHRDGMYQYEAIAVADALPEQTRPGAARP